MLTMPSGLTVYDSQASLLQATAGAGAAAQLSVDPLVSSKHTHPPTCMHSFVIECGLQLLARHVNLALALGDAGDPWGEAVLSSTPRRYCRVTVRR